MLYDNPADQRRPEIVFGLLHQLLRLRLAAGARVTCVDATNITRRDRRHFFAIVRQFARAVEALYFDVPLEVCLERNLCCKRRVPEEAIRRMARCLEPPTLAEGFRRIDVLRPRGSKARPTRASGRQKPRGRKGGDTV